MRERDFLTLQQSGDKRVHPEESGVHCWPPEWVFLVQSVEYFYRLCCLSGRREGTGPRTLRTGSEWIRRNGGTEAL